MSLNKNVFERKYHGCPKKIRYKDPTVFDFNTCVHTHTHTHTRLKVYLSAINSVLFCYNYLITKIFHGHDIRNVFFIFVCFPNARKYVVIILLAYVYECIHRSCAGISDRQKRVSTRQIVSRNDH